VLVFLCAACVAPPTLSPPRSVVLPTGSRFRADHERLDAIHERVLAQIESITCRRPDPPRRPAPPAVLGWDSPPDALYRPPTTIGYCTYPGSVLPIQAPSGRAGNGYRRSVQDPRTHVTPVQSNLHGYPWQTLVLQADTVRFQYPGTHPDARTAYTVYAHLHLMRHQERLAEWLPEAEDTDVDGFALERAIVERMADAWLMGRAAFYLDPYPLLDALLAAREAGWLDAFLLTARADEFPEAREAWLARAPGALDAYRAWSRQTLGGEPPGVRAGMDTPR